MLSPDPLHPLWHTPLGVYQWEQAADVNPLLARVCQSMRATDPNHVPGAPFYASDDKLLHRVKLTEWQAFIAFLVDSLRQTVVLANQGVWPTQAPGMRIGMEGIWFSNRQRWHPPRHTYTRQLLLVRGLLHTG